MRKILCFLIVLFAAQMFVACVTKKEGPKSPAQLYAEECPGVRSWGFGMSKAQNVAKMTAESDARRKMFLSLKSAVDGAVKESGLCLEKYTPAAESENTEITEKTENKEDITAKVANRAMRNTQCVKLNTYMLDGKYCVYVCYEFGGGIEAVKNNIMAGVKAFIPEEELLKLDYELQVFEKTFVEQFGKAMPE